MPVRTKPVRIFEADHGALRLLAGVEGRSPAQVFHTALTAYLAQHRAELTSVFARAQEAFASGDTEALAGLLSSAVATQADELVADIDSLR